MAKRLTALAIEKLKPRPERYEVPDGDGLYRVVQPSGERSWTSRHRINGKSAKAGTLDGSASLKEAREWNYEIKAKIRKGIDPRAEKKAARAAMAAPLDLVEIAAERWLSQYVRRNLRAASITQAEGVMRREVIPAWGGRRLASIRRADIYHLRDLIEARDHRTAANRAVSWFGSLCSWAVERGLIENNPCLGLKRLTEQARTRTLSELELTGVLLAHGSLGVPYDQFIRLLILTAQRKSEVSGMRWSEIDFDRRLWVLPASRTKNKREHQLPLSDLAVEILEAMPRIGDFVFTISGSGPISGFTLMKRRIDREIGSAGGPWVLHDLRRTAATSMAELGIGLPVVEKILNHTSGSFSGVAGVYQRYSYEREMRAAMETWARYVDSLTTPVEPNVIELRR